MRNTQAFESRLGSDSLTQIKIARARLVQTPASSMGGTEGAPRFLRGRGAASRLAHGSRHAPRPVRAGGRIGAPRCKPALLVAARNTHEARIRAENSHFP